MPDAYYKALVDFYESGGDLLAAGWLMSRNVMGFNMFGNAPKTAALEKMRLAARSKLDELIEDAVVDRYGPMTTDLVALDEVTAWAARHDLGTRGDASPQQVKQALIRAGARAVLPNDERVSLGKPPEGVRAPECSRKQARLLALRDVDRYLGLTNRELVAEFWRQRAAATAAAEADFTGRTA